MFRANVNAILIDVRAVDRNGEFVRDLKAEDFRVFEDEISQPIVTFGLVDLPTEPEPPPTVAGVRVESDVASNARSVEGRLYVIVMDDKPNMLTTRGQVDGMPATFTEETYRLRAESYRRLAREFVESHLTYGDRAALITTSGRSDMAQEFTNNRQRLVDAIAKFELGYGQAATTFDFTQSAIAGDGRGTERLDTTRSAMIGLRSLASYLAQIPARRKAIVLFSERMGEPFSTNNFTLNLPNDEAKDFRDLIEASARANVSIYPVDPIGSPFGRGARGNFVNDDEIFDQFRREGLTSLAEATGGFALTGSNAFTDGFDRIVEENSSYYLLGYSSSNLKTDGKFRRIRVEVNRPGVTVRTRSGYFGREVKPTAAAPSRSNVPTGLQQVLQSPLPVPGLTMSVSSSVFRGADSRANVSVIVEARGGDLQFSESQARISGGMRIVMVALNPDGKTVAGESGALSMSLSRQTHQAISQGGVRVLSRIALKPGRYQLKVAAEDAQYGVTKGVVLYDLDVPDFSKGPLSLSGVGIASAVASQMPTTGPDRSWQQAMKALPTTRREFAASDELREYVEVYVNDKKVHEVDVTTTVRSEAGLRVFTQRQTLMKERGAKDKFVTHQVLTSLPLKTFTPGKYVLTVEALGRGLDARPATRQIPFSVR
jgi:VWFA-related protein